MKCEEMRAVAGLVLQCNYPATKIIHSPQDKTNYIMCDECAWHSVKNRGMKEAGMINSSNQQNPRNNIGEL